MANNLLETGLIIRETLYSADEERSNCRTLGPCFRGVASGVLEVFITLISQGQGQEFLLLDEPRINWADWSGQKKPKIMVGANWPTLFDGWTSWLNRVERAKADHWKRSSKLCNCLVMTFTARNPFSPPHSVSGPSLPTLFISSVE